MHIDVKTIFIAIGTAISLSACASVKTPQALAPAPLAPSSSMQLADSPVVATTPDIARTPPIKVVKELLKGDSIEIKPPVPVLSAVMPNDVSADTSADRTE